MAKVRRIDGIAVCPVRIEDLAEDPALPVGKFQPSQLPQLRKFDLSDEQIIDLQGPAAML